MMLGLGQSLAAHALFEEAVNPNAPVITGLPALTGVFQRGETLTAEPAPVTGAPTPAITWVLQQGDGEEWIDISGEQEDPQFFLNGDRVNQRLRIRQIATNEHGVAEAVSEATPMVREPQRTLFFINHASGDWNDAANWSEGTPPSYLAATQPPNDGDDVFIYGNVGTPPTVPVMLRSCEVRASFPVNLTGVTLESDFFRFFVGADTNGYLDGNAEFRDGSRNSGTVTGSAVVYFPCPYPMLGILGSVTYVDYVFGCTDPSAYNYNMFANTSDGSCVYE